MTLAAWILLSGLVGTLNAAEAPPETVDPPETVFDKLTVVGEVDRVAGSAHVLGLAELEVHDYNDIHRALRQVPGVNLQEEEGFGLRPNIGIRGTGVERSQKVTLMEDGVPIAPAPYAAPAAYYSPTAGRMEGLEVRKGTSAVREGPHTTGGVVNYLSTSIPGSLAGKAEIGLGSDGLLRGHAHIGDSNERFGWLLEGFHLSHSGFKELDEGGDTGFDLTDGLGKLRIASKYDAEFYQAAELKLGWTQQDGAETYVGLTEADFAATPFRRYAGSAADRLDTEHKQAQISYFAQLNPSLDLTAVAYNNDFFRNWHKLQSVSGTNVDRVLADPTQFAEELAVLRGELDSADALSVRNNRRDYFSRGVEFHLGTHFGVRVRHDLEIGLRVHRDEEDRFQEEDRYAILAGRPMLAALGSPGSQANRVASAAATAVFIEDRIAFGRWTLIPGARFESIDLQRIDFGKADPLREGTDLMVRENEVTKLVPGFGLHYQAGERTSWFAGVYQGFSPPTPGSREEVEPEESDNLEFGWRYSGRGLAAEATLFYNDYDNLLGTDTLSGGGEGSGEQFNGGAAEIQGLEASVVWEVELNSATRMPVRAVYTYTDTEFSTSFETSFADWAPRVEKGDEIPYVPQHQFTLGVGLQRGNLALSLDGNFNDTMRTTAGRGPIVDGTGIPRRWTFDLAAERSIGSYRVFAQLRNVVDETYLTARRPAGLRPGMSRSLVVGAKVDF